MDSSEHVKHNYIASKDSFRPSKTMVKFLRKKSLMHLAMVLFTFSNLIVIASAKKNDTVQEELAHADAGAAGTATLLKMGATANNRQYLGKGHSGTVPKVSTLNLLHCYLCTKTLWLTLKLHIYSLRYYSRLQIISNWMVMMSLMWQYRTRTVQRLPSKLQTVRW